MSGKEVMLLGMWGSPFVRRVEWVLKLKGIPYEYVEEDLSNKSSLLLNYNPIWKKVPVLVHRGKPVAESSVILEYIDETWKENPILPDDPYERAMARFWAKFAGEEFGQAVWRAFWAEGEEKSKAVESATEVARTLEEGLNGNRFFGGESIGFVDIIAGWIPYWLGVFEEVGCMKVVDPQRLPLLTAWMKNMQEVAVIKENLPPRDRLVSHIRRVSQHGAQTGLKSK